MEKDFDCIYLEKPTNLLVNVDSKKGIEAENLIRFVYQMEFLMERGEVSFENIMMSSGESQRARRRKKNFFIRLGEMFERGSY